MCSACIIEPHLTLFSYHSLVTSARVGLVLIVGMDCFEVKQGNPLPYVFHCKKETRTPIFSIQKTDM